MIRAIFLTLTLFTTPLSAAPPPHPRPIVAELRDLYAKKCQVYPILQPHAEGHELFLLKLTEEEILFNKYNPDGSSQEALDALRACLLSGLTKEQLEMRLQRIRRLGAIAPHDTLALLSEMGYSYRGLMPSTLGNFSKILPDLAKNKQIQNYMKEMAQFMAQEHRRKNPQVPATH